MPLTRLTRCAVLTALALALSLAERAIPLAVLFPLPGLRLGLANLVTVFAGRPWPSFCAAASWVPSPGEICPPWPFHSRAGCWPW